MSMKSKFPALLLIFGFLVAATPLALAESPSLNYSSYFGGDAYDSMGWSHILHGPDDSIYVAVATDSGDLPVSSFAYDRTHNGGRDIFVAKFSADHQLVWGTYLGGQEFDTICDIKLTEAGDLLLAGNTYSPNFPTTEGAFQTAGAGGLDAFVALLSEDGRELVWSTFIGGSDDDAVRSMASSGEAIVLAGATGSFDFPVSEDGYQRILKGEWDGWVFRLSGDGTSRVFGTYLGGSYRDYMDSVAVTSSGDIIVAGRVPSPDYPTTMGSYDPIHNGYQDIAVSSLSSDGQRLIWSTFIGGYSYDVPNEMLITEDSIVIVGTTWSDNFPITSA